MQTDIGYFEEGQLGKTYDVKLLRRMAPFIRPFAKPIFWSVLLVVCITLLDLALPYATKVAIDRYIVPKAETATENTPEGPKSNTRWITADLHRADVHAVVGEGPGDGAEGVDGGPIGVQDHQAVIAVHGLGPAQLRGLHYIPPPGLL